MQEEDQTASVPADSQHLARLTGRNGWRHTLCFPPLPFPLPSLVRLRYRTLLFINATFSSQRHQASESLGKVTATERAGGISGTKNSPDLLLWDRICRQGIGRGLPEA